MPLYMDRHDVPGVTAEQVAQAHLADLDMAAKFKPRSRGAAGGSWLPPFGSRPVTASRPRQADPAERLLPGRAQAAFANPASRAVHPC
jgi:hypothetical protein